MPRNVSPLAFANLTERTGTSPVLIVGVNWGAGIEYYASRTVTMNNLICKGSLTSCSDVSSSKRDDNLGSTSSASVSIRDYEGLLKLRLDITRLENTPCLLMVCWEETGILNNVTLLQGRMVGPITWSEDSASLSFEIESQLTDLEIGYSATHEDFADLTPEAEGVPWPLVFGKCAHVPAVPVRKHTEGYLKLPIRLISDVYKISRITLPGSGTQVPVIQLTNKNINVITTTTNESGVIYIRGYERFPVKEKIQIIITGVVFEGKFDDPDNPEKFKVSQAHLPKYQNVKLASSLPDDSALDSDTVIYLDKETPGIANHHCYFHTSSAVEFYNYCVSQKGTAAKFKYKFFDPATGKNVTNHMRGRVIDRIYQVQESGLANEVSEKINRLANTHAYWNSGNKPLVDFLDEAKKDPRSFWNAPMDTPVRMWNIEDPDIYVVSAVKCSEVHAVFAYRSITLEDGRGTIKVLTALPTTWYTVQLESNYEVNHSFVTGIIFDEPFEERDATQHWEQTIYVTATSTVGPNTADIIKYLLETYTDLVVNQTSFDQVKALLEPYPSHFAIFDRQNAVHACQEIAWQARCALILDSGIVSIRYLAARPGALLTLNDASLAQKKITFGFTETGSIITKLVAEWTETYKYIPVLTRFHQSEVERIREVVRALSKDSQRREEPKKLNVYTNNINIYGVRSRTVNMYIYNNEESVLRTLNFWGNRLSNSWRLITVEAMLPALLLQQADAVGVVLADTTMLLPSLGEVQDSSFNWDDLSVKLTLWLPMVAGTQTEQSNAYPG